MIEDNLYPDVAAGNTSNDATDVSLNYRFSGYHMPKIQLDSTGPGFAVPGIHPYYFNQPTFWLKGYFSFSTMVCLGQQSDGFIDNIPQETLPPLPTNQMMLSSAPRSYLPPLPVKASSLKTKLFGMKPL